LVTQISDFMTIGFAAASPRQFALTNAGSMMVFRRGCCFLASTSPAVSTRPTAITGRRATH
jgi:hypothetical protein